MIAVFPTVWKIDGDVPFWGCLDVINEQSRFRELLFALVPAVALPISTITDFLTASRDADEVEKLSALVALLANVFFLSAGFVGFFTIPDDVALGHSPFVLYSWVLKIGLLVSLVTEVWISIANKRQHRLHERNWNELRRVKGRVKVLENRR
jgi:hypothetical protein